MIMFSEIFERTIDNAGANIQYFSLSLVQYLLLIKKGYCALELVFFLIILL